MSHFAILLWLAMVGQQPGDWPEWRIPEQISQCIAKGSKSVGGRLSIHPEVNPFYLRGDFDGDRVLDIAIALQDAAENVGILICSKVKGVSVLGSIQPNAQFSDVPGDRIVSLGWCVIDKMQLRKALQENNPKRHVRFLPVLGRILGEIIYMPDSEGMGIIYFSGGRYHWYTINSPLAPQVQQKRICRRPPHSHYEPVKKSSDGSSLPQASESGRWVVQL